MNFFIIFNITNYTFKVNFKLNLMFALQDFYVSNQFAGAVVQTARTSLFAY